MKRNIVTIEANPEYLMDKEFIASAIKRELERRGLTNGDQENNKT